MSIFAESPMWMDKNTTRHKLHHYTTNRREQENEEKPINFTLWIYAANSEHDNVTRVSLTEPQNRLTTDFHFTSVSCQSIEHSNPSFFILLLLSVLLSVLRFFCAPFSRSASLPFCFVHTRVNNAPLEYPRAHTHNTNIQSSVSNFIGNPCIGAIPYTATI